MKEKRKIPVPIDINTTFTPKVESDVPLPPGRSPNMSYPWKEMTVGDSFFVPCADKERARLSQISLVASGRRFGKVVTRTVTEDGVLGIRCWKIA